ncbi:MAG TPA: efflux RND transporter periplasmic adaptor subunit [Micromonosporaceae bacterium]|nr:efflux RND transporter periplasmic adaptor subunit [Micromonosporaceae bacterium]
MGDVRRVPPPRLATARRFRLSGILLACVTLISLTAASCGDDEPAVALGSASVATVSEIVDAPATVTARAAATLTAPADGTLAVLRVGPGDRVRAGQVLAVIDSPQAQANLDRAAEALAAARRAGRGFRGGGAGLSDAQRATDEAADEAFAAARTAAGKITDQRLRSALLAQVQAAEKRYAAAARTAQEAVRAVQRGVRGVSSAVGALAAAQRVQAEQAYDLAKATVDALTLRAPIGGVVQLGGTASPGAADALTGLLGAAGAGTAGAGGVGTAGAAPNRAGAPAAGPPAGVDVAVPVGGRVTAGTPLLTVVDVSQLGLVAQVDETDVLLTRPGQAATVELDAATGASYPARVQSVDVLPTQSASGGVSYKVRLSLAAGRYPDGRPAPTPRPGMSAVARLKVRSATDAVTVPAAAVFSADGRDAVWLVRDGRAEQVPVTVGVQGQELVQIVDGVRPGQQVVVRGTDQVRGGQQVP